MAIFTIDDYISFGTKGYHNATTWEVATDENFENIIDRSYKDRVNVTVWHSPLPKPDGSGYYADLSTVYCRAKIWIDDVEANDWFYMKVQNQNEQKVIYTEDGKEDIVYESSLELGLK